MKKGAFGKVDGINVVQSLPYLESCIQESNAR